MPCRDYGDYESSNEMRQQLNGLTAELCHVRKWVLSVIDPKKLTNEHLGTYRMIVAEHTKHREQDRQHYIGELTKKLREHEDAGIRLLAIGEEMSPSHHDKIDALKANINRIVELTPEDFLKGHPEF